MNAASVIAPAWRRFAAIVYDLLAVVAIVMVVGLIAQVVTGGRIADERGHLLAWWYQPLQGLVVGAYFFVSWTRGGQTLGMRPWRIRVTDAAGRAAGGRRGLIRLVVAALPLLLLALYPLTSLRVALAAPLVGWALLLLPALFDHRRRGVHDMLAGTEVRRLPT
ncbi:RDD family protein [Luteibacter sp. CQ10]|uniref:RDD family protein n=1 Tax=Luteibacter sp. CQ10 TaxID=2805821 RepID=UPI0034A1127B